MGKNSTINSYSGLMRERIFIYGTTLLALFWIGFVTAKYFRMLIHLPWPPFNWNPKVILPLVLVLLFNVVAFISNRIGARFAGRVIVAFLAAATVLLLGLAADHLLWLKAILFFPAIVLSGFGAIYLYRALFRFSISYWAGLLLSIILIQFWLLATGLLSVFRPWAVLPFIFTLSVLGIVELWKNWKIVSVIFLDVIDNLSGSSVMFIGGIWLTLAAAFIAANAPETYSDAIRVHVPYMMDLVREGALKPNYYWYSHLMPSPIQLTAAGGYLVLGEIGAKWVTWFIGFCATLIIIAEVYDLTKNRTIALATGFSFVSVPYIWLWLTTNYYDLAMTTFCIAGLACFRRAIVGQKEWLPLAGLFLGFAVTAKLNALVFVAAMLIAFLVYQGKSCLSIVRQRPNLILMTFVGFTASIIPWYLLVWHWTGNPVFPFMNSYFKSPYITSSLIEQVGQQYAQLFSFPYGWWDLFLWPWSMTYKTSSFGEAPDGAMGPLFLIAYPIVLIYLLVETVRGNKKKDLISCLFLAGLLFVGGCALLVKAPYLRYWFPGLAVIVIVMGASSGSVPSALTRHYPQWAILCGTASFVLLSLMILFAWGVRLNYAAPDGVGWSLYHGKISRDDYLSVSTGGVYQYVNEHIEPGESVMAVNYQFLNTIKNFSFQIMPWYDPVIGLKDLKDYDALIQKENVRYWIVQDNIWRDYYRNLGVADKYWRDELLVYRKNGFSVYTTKPDAEPKPIEEIKLSADLRSDSNINGWYFSGPPTGLSAQAAIGRFNNQLYKIITPPVDSGRLTGSILCSTDREGAAILAHIVWYQDDREIGRSVSSVQGHANQQSIISLSEKRPAGANKLLIIVNPWRDEDGTVTVLGGNIQWWK